MNTISTDELKRKLDQGDHFMLLMTYNEWAYKSAHIPGSKLMETPEDAVKLLSIDDEIIVYCINEGCQASIQAYQALKNVGFSNLKRYSAGIEGWEAAGLEVASTIGHLSK